MNFKELLQQTPFESVSAVLEKTYAIPKDVLQEYEVFYTELLQKEPTENQESFTIYIEDVEDVDNNHTYPSVFGKEKGSQETFRFNLTPRNEVLGYIVSEEAIQKYSIPGVIAYTLYDITFYGIQEERIEQTRNMLSPLTQSWKKGKVKQVEDICMFCDGKGDTDCLCKGTGKMIYREEE